MKTKKEPEFELEVDGILYKGPESKLNSVFEKLGYSVKELLAIKYPLNEYYYSQSDRTFLKISEMNDFHLFNAFIRMFNDKYIPYIKKIGVTEKKPLKAFESLFLMNDFSNEFETLSSMFCELNTRCANFNANDPEKITKVMTLQEVEIPWPKQLFDDMQNRVSKRL